MDEALWYCASFTGHSMLDADATMASVFGQVNSKFMNRTKALLALRGFFLVLAPAIFFVTSLSTRGQAVPHLTVIQPGGMPGIPVMTGISRVTNGVTMTWEGPSGFYQVWQKVSLRDAKWVAVGKATNLVRSATVTTLYSNAFFRVSGPSPRYLGAQACAECHQAIHDTEVHTRHAGAFTNAHFIAAGGQTNGSCLPCHTVGYGLPTGFVSASKTPLLAGVQCENCHGPAANHAANPNDPTVVPRVELAATVCGGCHTDSQHPTYDEWKTSGHAEVVPDALAAMSSSTNNIDSCGRCHSGSARLALIQGLNPVATLTNDFNVAITCAVCHDPHQTNSHPAQLRNPVVSTNDYFITTSGVFTNQYNPSVNLCAQCHNHRGAAWTSSSRAPHHSPQYNMLLGTVGELDTGLAPNQPGSHALLITNQCVGCHMQTADFVSAQQPAITGHSFQVELYNNCLKCHPLPELLVAFTTSSVSNQIQQVKADLDFWAATQAPAQLWTNYGTRSWEYTTPGDLSPGGSGPSAADQALIPVNIQKARFNLYVVLYDGSYGVHNGPYTITLLDTADNWIQEELNP